MRKKNDVQNNVRTRREKTATQKTNLPNKPMEDGTIITPTNKVLFMEWMPRQS